MNNHPFYSNDQLVKTHTEALLAQGIDIFQIWKKGKTNQEHCKWLLKHAEFPHDARVLDIACGVGAVAKTMKELRPDLHFSLQNCSWFQLDKALVSMPKYYSDMNEFRHIPIDRFDAVMICYALGHVTDLNKFMMNVELSMKLGGVFFVYDLVPTDTRHLEWMHDELGYDPIAARAIQRVTSAWASEFREIYPFTSELNTDDFERACGKQFAAEVREKTKPVIYRLTTCAVQQSAEAAQPIESVKQSIDP